MKKRCFILNPLQRDGTNQNQRFEQALHPSSALIDEREIDDLLMYALRFASQIRYFGKTNERDGDWVVFIENDISTLLSVILSFDNEDLKKSFDLALLKTNSNDPAVIHEGIRLQFKLLFGLISTIDQWYRRSVTGLELESSLRIRIKSVVNDCLRNCLTLCRIFKKGTSLDFCLADTIIFSEIWNTENIEESSFIDDPSLLMTDPALLRNIASELKKNFDKVLREVTELQQASSVYLDDTLNKYPEHQPYMALFLAFLKIFMYARDHLNTLTWKHLDFYYRDVLQIATKPENPDQVHIVFELAKSFDTYLIEKGTLFKDGKDNNSAEILFSADSELIVNKATIDPATGFKSVFIDKLYEQADPGNHFAYQINNIHAASVANSSDGTGGAIEDADGKWFAFGNADMPFATIGFAIASPLFQLAEGKRLITFTFEFSDPGVDIFSMNPFALNQVACDLKNNVIIQFSGIKGWVTASLISAEIVRYSDFSGSYIFTAELMPDAGSIVNYDDKTLASGFASEYPVARFILDNEGFDVLQMSGSFRPLKSFDELRDVSKWLERRALVILNNARKPEDIAGREPQVGPVIDHPLTGYGDQIKDYDIGITVAKKILQKKSDFGSKGFTSLSQLENIPGFGIDKLNDLLFSSDCADSEKIISNTGLYSGDDQYGIGDYVIYSGDLFRSGIAKNKGFRPDVNPGQWLKIDRSYPYRYFRPLELKKLLINVAVTGVKTLVLESDTGTLNPVKPFMPFGAIPRAGNCFYLGSREIFTKCLSGPASGEVKIHCTWSDLPEKGFKDHYKNYKYYESSSKTFKEYFTGENSYFTCDVEVLSGNEWKRVLKDQPLFTSSGSNFITPKTFKLNDILTDRNHLLEQFSGYSPGLERGFIRFKLNQHFFHKLYAEVVTTAALHPDTIGTPKEPYTPIISEITVDYSASHETDYSGLTIENYDNRVEQLFHIGPFGVAEFYAVDGEADEKVLTCKNIVPAFLISVHNPKTGEPLRDKAGKIKYADAEGTLYVGIEYLMPEQNLAILFQVAEGSENPDQKKQEITWSYLSGNRWIDFNQTQILSDDTNGLLKTGIIVFTMPDSMNSDNTILPAGKYWIRASVSRSVDAVCKVIAVLPQAIKATFLKSDKNDLSRLNEPLSANQVNKLKNGQAAIKKVMQPYTSFNGRLAEISADSDEPTGDDRYKKEFNEYYIRVSERLRHKGRGITIFDYERLVLQQFPEVYKVKCINHTGSSCEHQPGFVTLVAIPNLRNRNAVDPFKPRLSLNTLESIHSYLKSIVSDFVELEVRNPVYEEVLASFNVSFMPGKDRGYYTTQLQDDIRKFLTPWLYDEGQDLILGGSLHRSTVLNFIEETGYVDFLTDFKMFHTDAKGKITECEEAIASTSGSTLVTCKEHIIQFDIKTECLNPNIS